MTQPIQYAVPSAAIYYKPPHRFDAIRLGIALPTGLFLAIACGAAYGAIIFRGRSIYVNLGIVVVTAVVLGLVTTGLLRFARVQHRGLAILCGTLFGLIALWASWVVWMHLVLKQFDFLVSIPKLATHPHLLYVAARDVSETGVWSYKGNIYRGPVLLILWLIEALILVLGCTLVAVAAAGSAEHLCRVCRKRCKSIGGLGRYDGTDPTGVREHLEAFHFDYLLKLGPVKGENDPEILLNLDCCPCGETNVFGADRVIWDDNGQGSFVLKRKPIIEGLLLNMDQVGAVKSLKGRLPAPVEDDADVDGEDNDDGDVTDDDSPVEGTPGNPPAEPDPYASRLDRQ